MEKFKTHYDNLQVTRSASGIVIKAAYKTLCQRHHADKNPSGSARADRIMQIINAAYAVLSDPEKRREHDAWITEQERTVQERHMPWFLPRYVPDARSGISFLEQGERHLRMANPSEAARCFENAIAIDWPNSDLRTRPYYQLRAKAYEMSGTTGPTKSIAEYGGAWHLARSGKFDAAIQGYVRSGTYDKKFPWAHNNLAWLLATCADKKVRNGLEAVRYATIACEQSDWNSWSFIDTLAAAHAELGNFEAALSVMERAVATAPTEVTSSIEATIASFRSGIPIRDFAPVQ